MSDGSRTPLTPARTLDVDEDVDEATRHPGRRRRPRRARAAARPPRAVLRRVRRRPRRARRDLAGDEHPGHRLDADAGGRRALPRGRPQPVGGVLRAARDAAHLRRADRDRRRARRHRAVRRRDRPGDHRPGRRAHRQRAALARRPAAQPAGPAHSTTSTTSSTRSRTTSPPATSLSSIFGGALGVGLAVLGALVNAFIVTVLTLYFLASLESTKSALYRLAPASRRDRVVTAGRPGLPQRRRLRLGRLHRRDVRRHLLADLPVRRGPRASTPSRWRSWSRCST